MPASLQLLYHQKKIITLQTVQSCYRKLCIVVTEICALLLPKSEHSRLPKSVHFSLPFTENFNKLVSEKIFFRHDPEVARFIFNYTNRSAKLFPSSILEEKAGQIKSSGKFSRAAFDAACDEFYPDTDKSVCLQYMMDCHAEITDSLIVKFTEKEKKDCLAEWEARGMKNTLDKILCRFVSL